MTRKTLYTISAIVYIALLSLVTVPPITALIDRVKPHILGLPCMQFFLIFVPLALAVWLIIWYLMEVRIQDREAAEAEKKEGQKHE
ncbi:MAG: hypothetical protein LBG82_04315 [Clostridiales Family XIII bacterium]|jgi:hypothetical protein|nr:hypothetical protein [Clostridiales Family XIII bacterium]